jgi:hypothetical protein
VTDACIGQSSLQPPFELLSDLIIAENNFTDWDSTVQVLRSLAGHIRVRRANAAKED